MTTTVATCVGLWTAWCQGFDPFQYGSMVTHTHTHFTYLLIVPLCPTVCWLHPHIIMSFYIFIPLIIFQKKTSIYCAGGSLTQKHADDKTNNIYIYISTQYTSYICNQFRLPQSHQASSWPGLRRVCAGLGSMIYQGVSPVLGSSKIGYLAGGFSIETYESQWKDHPIYIGK